MANVGPRCGPDLSAEAGGCCEGRGGVPDEGIKVTSRDPVQPPRRRHPSADETTPHRISRDAVTGIPVRSPRDEGNMNDNGFSHGEFDGGARG